jgi:uncharacterized membrane protein (GlpM family)
VSSREQERGGPGRRDADRPRVDMSRLRQAKPTDFVIRFAFGGLVSVVAALIGHWTTPEFGGIFTAFPAILLASLTLIGKREGDEPSAEDAEGGALGGIALTATAAVIALTLSRVAGAVSLVGALAVWLILGLLLYWLAVKIGWLHTPSRDERPPSDE